MLDGKFSLSFDLTPPPNLNSRQFPANPCISSKDKYKISLPVDLNS